MNDGQFLARRPTTPLTRWLFPMMALGGLSASLGPLGKWVGLAIFAPLIAGLWWRERVRWLQRRIVRQRAEFEPQNADEFRMSYNGFELLRREEVGRSVNWEQIRGIAAFIDIQPNGDVLTIGLRIDENQRWICIPADLEGFPQLRIALRERYGVPPGWEEAVWQGPRGLNWRRLWGEARPPGDVCWKCGYDLRGNESGACSECGTEFRWRDPTLNEPKEAI